MGKIIEKKVNSLFVEMGMWAPFYENYKCQQARLVKLDYKTICNYKIWGQMLFINTVFLSHFTSPSSHIIKLFQLKSIFRPFFAPLIWNIAES